MTFRLGKSGSRCDPVLESTTFFLPFPLGAWARDDELWGIHLSLNCLPRPRPARPLLETEEFSVRSKSPEPIAWSVLSLLEGLGFWSKTIGVLKSTTYGCGDRKSTRLNSSHVKI